MTSDPSPETKDDNQFRGYDMKVFDDTQQRPITHGALSGSEMIRGEKEPLKAGPFFCWGVILVLMVALLLLGAEVWKP